MPDTFAVVTGGGTAGHVLPALAVAEALVARGHEPSTITYAGCERGIEVRLVPATPFPHRFYDVVGLQRRLSATQHRVRPEARPQHAPGDRRLPGGSSCRGRVRRWLREHAVGVRCPSAEDSRRRRVL